MLYFFMPPPQDKIKNQTKTYVLNLFFASQINNVQLLMIELIRQLKTVE